MLKIIRVWDEVRGWMHHVVEGNTSIAMSKHRDELIEAYPHAEVTRTVACVDNTYQEGE